MSQITRRDLIKLFGAGAAASTGLLGASKQAYAKSSAHIVIVGGGIGGAAFAKYMRLANADVKITMIEPNPQYTFCPGSNEILSGHETLENLTVNYNTLKSRFNIDVVQDIATEINYEGHQISTIRSGQISYDKLVVSPGPDFDYQFVDGYDAELAEGDFPHAWKAGPQTLKLKQQIDSMRQGGTMVISAPSNPYRCPPAPYERASFIANMLKQSNPTAKLLILDSKTSYVFQNHFEHYWKQHHNFGQENARIEWVSAKKGGTVIKLDAAEKIVTTVGGEKIKADVINIIPEEKAGRFAIANGLALGKNWVPYEPKTFASKVHPDVYVIGDTVDAPMPKTGYVASNQAKVVAAAINDLLAGKEPGTPFITNNCVAMAGEDYGMTITATFRYTGETKGKGFLTQVRTSKISENPSVNRIRAEVAKNWQRTFRKDMFS
ncbi:MULTISPECIES: NAD(P)/FAD-dependent oxidoreductase [Thiomicrorhabdus]|uniref:NAD(P)/FAD-dependent oxidoreductase n=1 Tax=Thiomicrorhabdus heinhorstiae TaxID=2748010 RepID=A0ABS0BU51_9GAMM|nr:MULTISPECIES: FAD/NAD(P)-binding oxidoreductase [Thiomicrorhabdus]MBF6057367.1 NAD(P)/FAD-dependent oxidoreductase [Thiomicrorhabdus heinhorstiae]